MKNVFFHTSFVDTGNAINMRNAISDNVKKCAKVLFFFGIILQ